MSANDTLVADLAKALRSARRVIQDEHDDMLRSACPTVDGKPDESYIDPHMLPFIRRYRRVLKKIDEALK